jgi:uncharacterized OB-fold protein
MSQQSFARILPEITDLNRHFWCGGKNGQLELLKCEDCSQYVHPPLPICNRCQSRALKISGVAGTGKIASFTLNHQPWFPGIEVPYCVAIVELDEQTQLRLTTNIINCDLDSIHIGMPVRVTFEQHDDVWLPLFEPYTPA